MSSKRTEFSLCVQTESDHVDTDVKVLLLLPCNSELGMKENYCDGWMIMFLWLDFVLFTSILVLNRFWYCKRKSFFLSVSFYRKMWLHLHLFFDVVKAESWSNCDSISCKQFSLPLAKFWSINVFTWPGVSHCDK